MKSYVVVIKLLDRKYSTDVPMYRIYTRIFNNYRELRDYLVLWNFNENEYIVYESTDIKIKKIRGIAR